MDSVDKFFQKSHYNITRVLLGIIGLWPFHSVKKRYAIYFGFLLLLVSGMTFEVYGEEASKFLPVHNNLQHFFLLSVKTFRTSNVILRANSVSTVLVALHSDIRARTRYL